MIKHMVHLLNPLSLNATMLRGPQHCLRGLLLRGIVALGGMIGKFVLFAQLHEWFVIIYDSHRSCRGHLSLPSPSSSEFSMLKDANYSEKQGKNNGRLSMICVLLKTPKHDDVTRREFPMIAILGEGILVVFSS